MLNLRKSLDRCYSRIKLLKNMVSTLNLLFDSVVSLSKLFDLSCEFAILGSDYTDVIIDAVKLVSECDIFLGNIWIF